MSKVCIYVQICIFVSKYAYIYIFSCLYTGLFLRNDFLRFGHFQDPSGAPSRAAGEPQGLSEAHDGV